ncbi:MAG: hypothetical protein WC464_04720 [Bdellovibrionales bacterium]
MTGDVQAGAVSRNAELDSSALPSEDDHTVASYEWMRRSSALEEKDLSLNANQRTSLSAMIAYISTQSGQSEFRLERKLSDRFNVPNPKCLPANDYDEAIRYLADILSA